MVSYVRAHSVVHVLFVLHPLDKYLYPSMTFHLSAPFQHNNLQLIGPFQQNNLQLIRDSFNKTKLIGPTLAAGGSSVIISISSCPFVDFCDEGPIFKKEGVWF